MFPSKDLKKAVRLLESENFTCVLVKDSVVHTSKKRGVSPMVDFLEEGLDLEGFSACDIIIGKAAASLFSLAKVKEVHGKVMSRSALSFLEKRNIPYSYDTLTDSIVNRKSDGPCPMEKAVENVDDEKMAFELIKKRLEELQIDPNS